MNLRGIGCVCELVDWIHSTAEVGIIGDAYKHREILENLSGYQFLERDPAPWNKRVTC
jgi:hypothetical protein